LYDFTLNGIITFNDNNPYDAINAVQKIWVDLTGRYPLEMVPITEDVGFFENVGLFSNIIDLSYSANIGWCASVVEEIVPNSQYWTRFLAVAAPDDVPNVRTGIHVENDYKGPHHYACHLMMYDTVNDRGDETFKTLYRYKAISFEEIATFVLAQLLEADLYYTDQVSSLTPSSTVPPTGSPTSIFQSITQAQFLRYILVVALSRFTQEGWTGWRFKTCEQQTVLTAGMNLTCLSDTFNLAIFSSLSEYFGSLSVLKSFKTRGKNRGGYLFVTIPLMCCYGNTCANVYQNFDAPDYFEFSQLNGLLGAINPSLDVATYNFIPDVPSDLPPALFVIPNPSTDTADTINLSQVSGVGITPAVQQLSEIINVLKGYVAISVAIANKDEIPFTILYFTRFVDMIQQNSDNFSLIVDSNFILMTNRVFFNQQTIGQYLGVPMPITCAPREVYQVIFDEHSIIQVINLTTFLTQTIRAAIQFVHPRESTNETSDLTTLNYTNTIQGKGGNLITDLLGMLM